MFILKILFAPVSLVLTLFTWLCAGLISCSAFVFKLASALLSLLAVAVLITYSVKNGIILLVIALLISPLGLPMLAVWIPMLPIARPVTPRSFLRSMKVRSRSIRRQRSFSMARASRSSPMSRVCRPNMPR